MSQEIYVKEMPLKFEQLMQIEDGYCNNLITLEFNSRDRFILKSLHDHDKELVAKVLERIKKYLFEKCDFDYGYYVNDGEFTISDLFNFLDQIQKEFEDE